jgi:hypothetical protein
MKRAAFGIRMHSGWGVMVAVSEATEVIDRRRIAVIADDGPRGNQPFHYASEIGLLEAEKYLSDYRAESEHLAREEIGTAVKEVNALGYSVAVAAVLQASGRPLPALPQILASHPLIHTAEGELFREIVSSACKSLKIPVVPYRERSLEEIARAALVGSAQSVTQSLVSAGKTLGPPWTADHKAAALAAYVALQR